MISDSDSSRRSHHPSLECFMADSPEGHVKSTHDGNTPPDGSDDGARERNQAPLRVRLEQLRERQKELEEACLQLEQEHAKLEREIGRRGGGGRARANARTSTGGSSMTTRDPPLFALASQNIAAAAALLEGLSEPTSPEVRRAHHKLRTLLEHTTQHQPAPLCEAGCQGCVRTPSPA
jgi:hypothetical protein